MEGRLERLRRFCGGHHVEKEPRYIPTAFLMSKKHRVAFCPQAKVVYCYIVRWME